MANYCHLTYEDRKNIKDGNTRVKIIEKLFVLVSLAIKKTNRSK